MNRKGSIWDPNKWNRWVLRSDEWPQEQVPGTRFDLYILGSFLVIASVLVMIGSLLAVTGLIGSGAGGYAWGAFGIVAALALYLLGRWVALEPGRRHWETQRE